MNEYQKIWVAALKLNPPKTTGRLAKTEADKIVGECCLGVACRAAGLRGTFLYGRVEYEGYGGQLPDSLCKVLGIKASGTLSVKGEELVEQFLIDNNIGKFSFRNLVGVNDATSITHAQMGELVETLFNNNGFMIYE